MSLNAYELRMASDLIIRLRQRPHQHRVALDSLARAQICAGLLLAKHGVDPDMDHLAEQLTELLAEHQSGGRRKHEHHEVETA